MRKVLEFLIVYSIRILLWFRYRIKVNGLEKLTPQNLTKPGGVLFLPNHPAFFIDPIVATLAVWPKFVIRPMIVEYMYYLPLVHGLMRFLNAMPIPNFSNSSNSIKRKKNDKVTQSVIEDLKKGQSFLLYPAGKVKHASQEVIGGASALHRILQDTPEANIVLMRIKGLWGSSFSRAIVGTAPTMTSIFIESIKIILKNLIFFTPRREIIIDLEAAPADFPAQGSRLELNRYLEQWYNRPDGLTSQKGNQPGDSLVLVSYSMWGDQFLPVLESKPSPDKEIIINSIPRDIQEKIIHKFAEMKECDPKQIKPEMQLAADLGLDSLDTAELVAFLQDQFDIEGVSASDLTTVGKVMAIAAHQVVCQEEHEDFKANLKKWSQATPHQRAHIAPGETMIEAFLNQCQLSPSTIACADEKIGIQTYSQLRLRTILIAEYLRKLPGKYLGIMLPASVAANLIIFASQLAGKVPLMINWTVGPRHLESVEKLSNVQSVISSWSFVDRLSNVDFNGIEDKLLMLEDVVREITITDKLKALFRSKLSTSSILKAFNNTLSENDEAVLLFTSGTESMPKGVPLSHRNILSNLKSSLKAAEVFTDDIVYGILPPFHSFGFTISGTLGLLSGVKIFFSPDPTDGKKLAKGFAKWGITIMCGAPTFIKGMLKAATPSQLKTMRLCVTGAEKAPPELFKMLEHNGKPDCLIEGYGITECSPVLTMNPVGGSPKGVGKPLPGIELRIVKPETEEPMPIGQQGLILARGPNIFKGYLNPGISSPFTEINGLQWYKTGDLGYLDAEGTLTISGRMKRFVKMGGEMVSLASIEDALMQMAGRNQWQINQEGPTFAVCAKEVPGGKTKLFVFNCFKTSLDDINNALKMAGFSNLVKITSVTTLAELPIMGTGKINYRQLESEYLANV